MFSPGAGAGAQTSDVAAFLSTINSPHCHFSCTRFRTIDANNMTSVAGAAASTDGFVWPWQHAFPPFFTIQPNADTRAKQEEAWADLIVAYCKHFKKEELVIDEAVSFPLFNNKEINRSLAVSDIVKVLDAAMQIKPGHFEWLDADKKKKNRCLVMWRTAQEWAAIIYRWVDATANQDSVFTVFELQEGDATMGEDFQGLPTAVLLRALRVLEQQQKAVIMNSDDADAVGVKFL